MSPNQIMSQYVWYWHDVLAFTSNTSFLIIILIKLLKQNVHKSFGQLVSSGPSKINCTKLHCEYISLKLRVSDSLFAQKNTKQLNYDSWHLWILCSTSITLTDIAFWWMFGQYFQARPVIPSPVRGIEFTHSIFKNLHPCKTLVSMRSIARGLANLGQVFEDWRPPI